MQAHPFPVLRQFSTSLDVQFLRKEDAAATDDDIKRLTHVASLVSLKQVHGNRAVIVREPSSRTIEADAVITDVVGLSLLIRFADCQGFIVYAPKQRVLALIHAGWRGMCKRVITSTFGTLRTEFNVHPADVFVAEGPSLCQKSAEFTDPHKEAPELAAFIVGNTIDLQKAAETELHSLGIPSSHINRSLDCTKCHPETYWTYRGGDRESVIKGFTNGFVATMIG